jgi:Mg-chelatase subunit ChlI
MDKAQRTQLVLDRMAYESDPDALAESAKPEQDKLMAKLADARARLKKVKISEEMQILISDICSRWVSWWKNVGSSNPTEGWGSQGSWAMFQPTRVWCERATCNATYPCMFAIPSMLAMGHQPAVTSHVCRLDVDGLRGDLVVNRAAKALVALEGRDSVTLNDIERVVGPCLNHRWVP